MSYFVSQNVTTTNQALNKFFTFPIHLGARIFGDHSKSYLTKVIKWNFTLYFISILYRSSPDNGSIWTYSSPFVKDLALYLNKTDLTSHVRSDKNNMNTEID